MIIIRSLKQRIALLPLFAVFLSLLSACSDKPLESFKLSGMTMGTSYHITIIGKPAEAAQLTQKIDFRLALINQQMSTYIASSELCKFNQLPPGEWQTVSPKLFDVLLTSSEIAWLTNGSFDITVAPLVDLWGFGPEHVESMPSNDAINAQLLNVGFQHLEFNLQGRKITKSKPIRLDLSAIAKGYGVDLIAKLLRDEGYNNFMVEVGGELYLSGLSPRKTAWRIAIEQPSSQNPGIHRAIKVSGKAVATSGDYRNYIERNGVRYSHTIDPRTGRPITHSLVSVTVIHEDVASADALATAISVMGIEAGMALAEQQNLAIYLISKTKQGFESQYSDAFKPYLD